MIECAECGKCGDSREMQYCEICGAPLCDECADRGGGMCERCGGEDMEIR